MITIAPLVNILQATLKAQNALLEKKKKGLGSFPFSFPNGLFSLPSAPLRMPPVYHSEHSRRFMAEDQ